MKFSNTELMTMAMGAGDKARYLVGAQSVGRGPRRE